MSEGDNDSFYLPRQAWSALFLPTPVDKCTVHHPKPTVMVFASRQWLLWHFANLPWYRCTLSSDSYIKFVENSGESEVVCTPHWLPRNEPNPPHYNEAKEATNGE